NGHLTFDGVTGGYLGLGIDEFGNFLNPGDNTATGPSQQGNRIWLRGAGNVSWSFLNLNFSQYYPSSLTAAQQQTAVAATCASGILQDYSNPSSPRAVLTAGTTVTGNLSGIVTRNSNQITGIPSIPSTL